MHRIKLGIRLESLGLPFRKALVEASRLGVAGVQFDAIGDLSPQQLSQSGRRELRHLLRTQNLELTALGCPLRRGLDCAEGQQSRLDHICKVMTLAYDLGPRVVVINPGKVPPDTEGVNSPPPFLREGLHFLGRYGDRTGTKLALNTGPDKPATLLAFLNSMDCGSLGINLNPANLVFHGQDAYEAARLLYRLLTHATARDLRRTSASLLPVEVPVGHGDIDWMRYLGVLVEVEYHGWLVVERESGSQRVEDIATGLAFLRRLTG